MFKPAIRAAVFGIVAVFLLGGLSACGGGGGSTTTAQAPSPSTPSPSTPSPSTPEPMTPTPEPMNDPAPTPSFADPSFRAVLARIDYRGHGEETKWTGSGFESSLSLFFDEEPGRTYVRRHAGNVIFTPNYDLEALRDKISASNYAPLSGRGGVSLARETVGDHHNVIGWMDHTLFGISQTFDRLPSHIHYGDDRSNGEYNPDGNWFAIIDTIEGFPPRSRNSLDLSSFIFTPGATSWAGAAFAIDRDSSSPTFKEVFVGDASVSIPLDQSSADSGDMFAFTGAITGLTSLDNTGNLPGFEFSGTQSRRIVHTTRFGTPSGVARLPDGRSYATTGAMVFAENGSEAIGNFEFRGPRLQEGYHALWFEGVSGAWPS